MRKKIKNILSIDPGVANTGWALSTGAFGTITTPPRDALAKRIVAVTSKLFKEICLETTPELVIVEDTFGQLMKPTTMLLGGLMSVFKTEFLLVPPAAWVRQLFGAKNKGLYKEHALQLCKILKKRVKTQHEADAIALLEWYKRRELDASTESNTQC